MGYLKLLRPVNLFIILCTQTFFWFGLILPILQSNNVSTWINNINAFLVFSITILLAGAGYIINDLFDVKTDSINLKRQVNGLDTLGRNNGLIYYFTLNMLALFLAIYLFWVSESIVILNVYMLCFVLLYFYSRKLKSTILWGNLLVSAFLASVPLFLFFLEPKAFQALADVNPEAHRELLSLLFGFSVFAFLTNLIRELIKDCEDYKGDLKTQIKTLATSKGLVFSANFILISIFMLLLVYSMWIIVMEIYNDQIEFYYFIFLICLPTVLSALFLILNKHEPTKFKKMSALFKGIMAFGLIYLFFYI